MKIVRSLLAAGLAAVLCPATVFAAYPNSGIITELKQKENALAADLAADGTADLTAAVYSPEGQMLWSAQADGVTGRTEFSVPEEVRIRAGSSRAFLTDRGTGEPLNDCAVTGAERLPLRRVSCNGQLYEVPTWEEGGRLYISTSALETMLRRTGLPVNLTRQGRPLTDPAALLTGAGESFLWDEPLDSAYIWTGMDVLACVPDESSRFRFWGLDRLLAQGEEAVSYGEFFTLLDEAVRLTRPERLAEWQSGFAGVRTAYAARPLTRLEAMMLTLYAACTMGEPYTEFNADWGSINNELGPGIWDELDRLGQAQEVPYWEVLPQIHEPYELGGFQEAPYIYGEPRWDFQGVALRYAYGRASALNGKLLFDYDSSRKSMHYEEPLTGTAALQAVSRLLDSLPQPEQGRLSTKDPEAVRPDFGRYTEQLLAEAHRLPEPSPRQQWHGINAGSPEYNSRSLDLQTQEQLLKKASEYGFDSARFMFTYQSLFDTEARTVDPGALKILDQIIAAAIRYRITLVLTPISLPGRWSGYNEQEYRSEGEFDLYRNPEKLEQAKEVWRVLATRYRDIPNSVLVFTPLWEAQNWNLSTGLPHGYEDLSPTEKSRMVADTYLALTQQIRAVSPDRLILFEPTPNNLPEEILAEAGETVQRLLAAGGGQLQLLTNYCEMPYVYDEMTAAEGEHIDHMNHSLFKRAYPVVNYGIRTDLGQSCPLTIHGLPAGTRVNLYISDAGSGGTLTVQENGRLVSSTPLSGTYPTGPMKSRYHTFAVSGKCISRQISQSGTALTFSYDGWGLRWSGIEILLPGQYAQDRWYFKSQYEVSQGLEQSPIPERRSLCALWLGPFWTPDPAQADWTDVYVQPETLDFTSGGIASEASARTIDRWGGMISEFWGGAAIRIEAAGFSEGTQYDSALRYYDDTLEMCSRYGLGWFLNESHNLFMPWLSEPQQSACFATATALPCTGNGTHRELLQIIQEHFPVTVLS